jgi:DNA-binding Xre family transcriptional regulator
MTANHNILWQLPINKKMNKTDLQKTSGASTTSMEKLTTKEQSVPTDILFKICKVLDYDFVNIMEAGKSSETDIDGEKINVRH